MGPFTPPRRYVIDWSVFNRAAREYAEELVGRVRPEALPPVPVDWLRRGLGIGAVVLATGLAAGAVLWALRPTAAPVVVTAAPGPVIPPNVARAPAPGAAAVVNYVRFTDAWLANGYRVETGWRFANSSDAAPEYQHCQVHVPNPGRGAVAVAVVADSVVGIRPYSSASMAPLTADQHREAIALCAWFPGTPLPASRRNTRPELPT